MRATPQVVRAGHAEGVGVLRAPLVWNAFAFGSFLVAFYVAYRYAMTFGHATASPFWFPISVLLWALLLTRPRWWPLVVLGTLPIRLWSDVSAGLPLSFLLETFAIDSAGAVLTAVALRRFLANPLRLDTVREYGIYGLFAVLLVPAAAAFGGAAARSIFDDDFWATWRQWFLGDALTHLVVTPTICYWVLTAPWRSKLRSPGRALEAALLSAGLVASAYVAFVTQTQDADFVAWRLYVPVPFLLWAAIRFGMLGATGAITCVVIASVGAALQGFGPFSGRSPEDTAIALQHFLLERAAPLYFIAILVEQKERVERSLRESELLLRTAADTDRNLAHASRLVAMGTLTAMIGHEVSQPLCAIRCNAEAGLALLRSASPPLGELREILSDICRDEQRADDVVTRIRSLARKRDFLPQPIDLNAAIVDVLRLASGEAARRQVRVVTELAPELPPVRGDVIQVQQMLLNLLMNSFDAMSDTPAPARQVSLSTRTHMHDRVEIAIADRGHGIRPDDLPRVFDSFFSTRVEGMGMGLSIARSIIETHEGRIWAENNATGGATFRVLLRAAG